MGEFINLSHLSFATGLSITFLSKVFKGRRNPSIKSAEIIADGLGMDLHVFLRGLKARVEVARDYESEIAKTPSEAVPQ